MAKRPAPTKNEIIKMQALRQIGYSHKRIGDELGWSRETVRRYITNQLTPEEKEYIKELVEKITKSELEDLTIIGAKARARLHEILDSGNLKPIEATAIMDRSFQQRQLLQNKPTVAISIPELSDEEREDLEEVAKVFARSRMQRIRQKAKELENGSFG